MKHILEVKDLYTSFFTHLGEVKAVNGVSFTAGPGEIIGIVGESGSGKSVTSLSIINLLPYPGKIVAGSIILAGKELVNLPEKEMQKIRGNEISIIFQDPMTSLNPVFTVGEQIMEPLVRHRGFSRGEARQKAVEMLAMVGIPGPEKRINQYPHEFSGGMRQRVMIAMALCCRPKLLIADEPTTALDVTVQAQIIELMKELRDQTGTAIILITHDLGVVAGMCSRVMVMYAGSIVEQGDRRSIFYHPRHPYTQGLLKSVPGARLKHKGRLQPIEGQPPDLLNTTAGCPFCPRCEQAMLICAEQQPPYTVFGPAHRAACWLYHPLAPRGERSVEI